MEQKIILLGDEERAPYHPISRIVHGVKRALSGIGYIEVCTEHQYLDMQGLEQFDAVISYLDNYKELNGLDNILTDYIETGGKILALHNGIITESGSRLEQAYGGNFVTHPPGGALKFTADGWLGAEQFIINDEPYMVSQVDEENRVFLEFEYQNAHYPAGWFRQWRKGRVIYLSPGHDEKTAEDRAFQKVLEKCMIKLLGNGK